jgi:DsbC/DsbD-like thiol-disulfide interchange protein
MMTPINKSYSLLLVLLSFTAKGIAQKPVSWDYTTKKISDKVYEVHLKATMNNGWHIYAQKQPKGGIGLPTTVKFSANPLLALKGSPQEKGKLEVVKNEEVDMENHQYEHEVEFVQTVTMKANIKTNITGTIEFMACTDERCLPPETVTFSLQLQ